MMLNSSTTSMANGHKGSCQTAPAALVRSARPGRYRHVADGMGRCRIGLELGWGICSGECEQRFGPRQVVGLPAAR